MISDTYPNSLSSIADKVYNCYVSVILKQQDKQIDSKIVEGLFQGLSRFLNQFTLSFNTSDESDQLVLLYKFTIAAIFSTSEKTFGVLKSRLEFVICKLTSTNRRPGVSESA